MREKMIAKIRQIIVDEKFKLDAYFLCGVASGLPNKELQTACEAYIEAIDHGHAIEVVREKMLEEMEKHPVLPGTVVLLPRRKEASVNKKSTKRRTLTPEEQIAFLQKCVMTLTILLAISVAAVILMFKPTMHYIKDEHFEIGQNYSTVIPSTATSVQPTAG
jgi:hypothetical protein